MTTIMASSFGQPFLKTKEDLSILCVSRDNRSFCINVVGDRADRTDGHLPNAIILSEQPLENFRVICRIASDQAYSKNMFNSKCRVIANSIEDKLKSFTILRELKNCI